MLTLRQAIELRTGTILYHGSMRNSDGTPLRARVNGKCKTWVSRPGEFKLPVKHGLRDCGYITHHNCGGWHLTEDEALFLTAFVNRRRNGRLNHREL